MPKQFLSTHKHKAFLFFISCLSLSPSYSATCPFIDLTATQSIKNVLERFESGRYAIEKELLDAAENDAHTERFFYAFTNLQDQYGTGFLGLYPAERDARAIEVIQRLIVDIDALTIDDGVLPTQMCAQSDGTLRLIDQLQVVL